MIPKPHKKPYLWRVRFGMGDDEYKKWSTHVDRPYADWLLKIPEFKPDFTTKDMNDIKDLYQKYLRSTEIPYEKMEGLERELSTTNRELSKVKAQLEETHDNMIRVSVRAEGYLDTVKLLMEVFSEYVGSGKTLDQKQAEIDAARRAEKVLEEDW